MGRCADECLEDINVPVTSSSSSSSDASSSSTSEASDSSYLREVHVSQVVQIALKRGLDRQLIAV